ncbi:tripartite tricarboxylate transporter substrate binding protein, partial [Bradyrhizobium sp. SHOUNA76]|nr:tripartite tricarboxylate transporter substrate binding protein [Bradyrhizobium sp. SHOUNA76]
MRRMKRLAAAIFLLGGFLATGPASADTYPSRPIRLLHGFAAGGAADTLSRIIADGLSKKLG